MVDFEIYLYALATGGAVNIEQGAVEISVIVGAGAGILEGLIFD
jgi:hypothetical protein